MMQITDAVADAKLAAWQKVLKEGHAGHKALRHVMRYVPGTPRCKICLNPFGGFGGRVCRTLGFRRSKKNPNICELCCEKMPLGGAEIETAILFADIRGSTGLAERLGPVRFAGMLNRFYATATGVLVRHDATIDKLIGDEVMAFFIPGFAGPDFKSAAVFAARDIMRELGYGAAAEPWLPVGIGIEVGTAFVGNVGREDYYDFTALGDPVNVAARIQAAAAPGEILVGEKAFLAVADRFPHSEVRWLDVAGRSEPVAVHSIRLAPDSQPINVVQDAQRMD
ncbi:adenylate/guanylate cyclase domain-containing protein [Microbaculum marinum]|uniref:Adenylate/guanylate cyclase domain-containing protein n=1 Tax=Microbaculum marinum TaxID=1764581 RepID=A0AAW9S023_9HYPH